MTVPWWTRKIAHLADVRVDCVILNTCASTCCAGSGSACSGFAVGALALEELRADCLRSGSAAACAITSSSSATPAPLRARDEADRDQVALAQRLLERRVQLARVDVALVQVAVDEVGVDLDHLLDQRAVRLLDATRNRPRPLAAALKKQSTTRVPPSAGRFSGRHSRPKASLDLRQQRRQVDALRIDLVDDDHAVEAALARPVHHPRAHHLDAGRGVDDDRRGLDRLERRQRLADEIGVARRVDQVDARVARAAGAAAPSSASAASRRSSGSKSLTVRAALDAAGRADRAGLAAAAPRPGVVLPDAAWPTSARVRIAAIAGFRVEGNWLSSPIAAPPGRVPARSLYGMRRSGTRGAAAPLPLGAPGRPQLP